MDTTDLNLVDGPVRLGAHALREIGRIEGLPERAVPSVFVERGDRYEAFGWRTAEDRSWGTFRAVTRDLVRFDDFEVTYSEAPAGDVEWLGMTCMARHGDGSLWLWKWARGGPRPLRLHQQGRKFLATRAARPGLPRPRFEQRPVGRAHRPVH